MIEASIVNPCKWCAAGDVPVAVKLGSDTPTKPMHIVMYGTFSKHEPCENPNIKDGFQPWFMGYVSAR